MFRKGQKIKAVIIGSDICGIRRRKNEVSSIRKAKKGDITVKVAKTTRLRPVIAS